MTKASTVEPEESQAKIDATFKKEERAREGAQAMLEYLANGREVRENMAKLKALRLAREAAGETSDQTAKIAVNKIAVKKDAETAPQPKTKVAAAAKKVVAKKASVKVKTSRALKRTQQ